MNSYLKSVPAVVALLVLWSSSITFAADALDRTRLESLAGDLVWLTLIHYEKKRAGTFKSTVLSPEYFLSEHGATEPLAELEATIAALDDASAAEPDKSVYCRFPARARWLAEKLKPERVYPQPRCAAFQAWAQLDAIDSLSMVFAAGHMKSPASYFGHNFLKINSHQTASSNHLLDQTINFGAEVPPDELGLTYFYNGVFGGYSAVFERQQFFRHMAKYGEEDLRDIWEYELDLTRSEIEFIVAHLWELQNHKLTYYFFRENCAYQIASLLGLVTPAQFVPRYMPWAMPYNVFASLAVTDLRSRPLVKQVKYHPSRRSRFHQAYFALTPSQRNVLSALVVESATGSAVSGASIDFALLAASDRQGIVDALIDYYEFRLRTDPKDAVAKSEKTRWLLERFNYPAGAAKTANKPALSPPHQAQKPGYASISAIRTDAFDSALELQLRPAYFDFLYQDIGRKSGGNFTLLDTSLLLNDNQLQLRRLDLVNITNLSPSVTGLPGDAALSWHVRLGFDQTNGGCERCGRPMFDAAVGKARKMNRGLTLYALAGARLQQGFRSWSGGRDNTLAVRLTAGLTGQVFRNFRTNVVLERHEDTGRRGLDRNRLAVSVRLGSNKHWDARLRYHKDIGEELGVTMGYYW